MVRQYVLLSCQRFREDTRWSLDTYLARSALVGRGPGPDLATVVLAPGENVPVRGETEGVVGATGHLHHLPAQQTEIENISNISIENISDSVPPVLNDGGGQTLVGAPVAQLAAE